MTDSVSSDIERIWDASQTDEASQRVNETLLEQATRICPKCGAKFCGPSEVRCPNPRCCKTCD